MPTLCSLCRHTTCELCASICKVIRNRGNFLFWNYQCHCLSHFVLVGRKSSHWVWGRWQPQCLFCKLSGNFSCVHLHALLKLSLWPGSSKSYYFLRTNCWAAHSLWCSFLQALHLLLPLTLLTVVPIFPWLSKFQNVCQISFTPSLFSTSLWLCWNALFNSSAVI